MGDMPMARFTYLPKKEIFGNSSSLQISLMDLLVFFSRYRMSLMTYLSIRSEAGLPVNSLHTADKYLGVMQRRSA